MEVVGEVLVEVLVEVEVVVVLEVEVVVVVLVVLVVGLDLKSRVDELKLQTDAWGSNLETNCVE